MMNIVINPSDIKAHVYRQKGQRMYIKISIASIGLYIKGFTMEPSPKYPEKGLWAQTPAYYVFKQWVHPIEFANDSPLWEAIVDEMNRAVDQHQHGQLDATVPDDPDPLAVVKQVFGDDIEVLQKPKAS